MNTSFNCIKRIISQNVLLAYPNFDLPFQNHTEAFDFQLGLLTVQNGKPLAFYSRKLNISQKGHAVGERELLAIVKM